MSATTETGGEKRAIHAILDRAKPNFGSVGRPCETLNRAIRFAELFSIALQIHDRDRALIVAKNGVIEEGDALTVAREPRMTYPARGLVENMAHGIFQAIHVVFWDKAHHGKILAIRRPVGILDGIQHRAWRSPAESQARQRPGANISGPNGLKVLNHKQLSGGRDGGEGIGHYSQGTQSLTVGLAGVKPERRVRAPARRADEAFPVGQKTAGVNVPLLEGQLRVRWRIVMRG